MVEGGREVGLYFIFVWAYLVIKSSWICLLFWPCLPLKRFPYMENKNNFCHLSGVNTVFFFLSRLTPRGHNRCKNWWNAFVHVSLCLESHSRKAPKKQYLFCGSVRFKLVFFSKRDCTTFTLHDLAIFNVESGTAHRIKINDHSCFHNRWPNLKTKPK